MKKLIWLLFLFLLTAVSSFSQDLEEYSVNQNAFQAKVYLFDGSKEKGLLYRIDRDSVLLAQYE